MERDPIRHEQILRKIEAQIKLETERELARKRRYEQIRERLNREVQEQTKDDR
jgi:hypothetical protein